MTWGDPSAGGDSSGVRQQLVQVQQIQATGSAFAAILEDGSVVTWGDSDSGGSSQVQEQLVQVHSIQATVFSFAAILEKGFVVTWDNPGTGGDSSQVSPKVGSSYRYRQPWKTIIQKP